VFSAFDAAFAKLLWPLVPYCNRVIASHALIASTAHHSNGVSFVNMRILGSVVRRVGAPYRRVRIPGSSDLRVCVCCQRTKSLLQELVVFI